MAKKRLPAPPKPPAPPRLPSAATGAAIAPSLAQHHARKRLGKHYANRYGKRRGG